MRLLTVPGVFSPRSDAWLLIDAVRGHGPEGMRSLDLFTGSGVVAVATAAAGAEATAVDISRRAVACAAVNAAINGVGIRVRRGDMLAPVDGERFDLITANPPYVPGEIEATEARGGARAWEGGPDGRALLDRFCHEAPAALAPGGTILLVQSELCGNARSLMQLESAGLEARVVASHRGPLGPLVEGRRDYLERAGLLDPGEETEEMVVIEATRRG